jgi:IclR family acetate operon transcriptional repressor
MIQVLKRAFGIMELLSPDEGMTLDKLTRSTGLNKATLCNILKSLVELGYVENSGNGNYLISGKFYTLAHPQSRTQKLFDIADRYARLLAEETRESGVIATFDNDCKVKIIAQSQFKRSVMVSSEVYKDLSLYRSVTGRILIAYAPEEQLKKIIEVNGYPNQAWNNISNWNELQACINEIRKNDIVIMENQEQEIKAFAVPILNAGNEIYASLGLTVPLSRLDEKSVLTALRENQNNMNEAIKSLN